MFTFASKSDEEIAAMQNENLLAEGVYEFVVKDIKLSISKNGNKMLEVRLGHGDRNIVDYLLSEGKMIFKLKHFMESIGWAEEYKKGQLDMGHIVNRKCHAKVVIKKGSPRPDGGFFNDKNSIEDYIFTPIVESTEAKEFFSDPIPF